MILFLLAFGGAKGDAGAVGASISSETGAGGAGFLGLHGKKFLKIPSACHLLACLKSTQTSMRPGRDNAGSSRSMWFVVANNNLISPKRKTPVVLSATCEGESREDREVDNEERSDIYLPSAAATPSRLLRRPLRLRVFGSAPSVVDGEGAGVAGEAAGRGAPVDLASRLTPRVKAASKS